MGDWIAIWIAIVALVVAFQGERRAKRHDQETRWLETKQALREAEHHLTRTKVELDEFRRRWFDMIAHAPLARLNDEHIADQLAKARIFIANWKRVSEAVDDLIVKKPQKVTANHVDEANRWRDEAKSLLKDYDALWPMRRH